MQNVIPVSAGKGHFLELRLNMSLLPPKDSSLEAVLAENMLPWPLESNDVAVESGAESAKCRCKAQHSAQNSVPRL